MRYHLKISKIETKDIGTHQRQSSIRTASQRGESSKHFGMVLEPEGRQQNEK